MVVNSEMNQKCKIMLAVIRDLVLDFILYFMTVWESTI